MTMTTRIGRRISAVIAMAFVASLIVSIGTAAPALAQEIVVQGNQRVDAETIRSYVSGAGSGSLEEARRSLLQTGMFSDVRISRRGSQLVVAVRENQIINRVV